MNTVTVKINGVEYNLKGKEDGKYLLNVAGYVDSKFKEISANNGKLGTSSVAVLAALNIADELFKCDIEIQDMVKKKNSLEERNLTLKERLKELKEDLEVSARLRNEEVESLKTLIYSMEEKVNEVDELQATITELNSKLIEAEKYKSEFESSKQQLEYSESENLKMKEEIKTLRNELNNSASIEDIEAAEFTLSQVKEEKSKLITENNGLKESIQRLSLRYKEAEIAGMESKETEEELRKAIMIKDAEIEEIKKLSLNMDEEKCEELKSQILQMENDLRDSINEKESLKARNKDMRFKLQNYKYKILDLEKKLIDVQFDLAVEKKDKNPLLR